MTLKDADFHEAEAEKKSTGFRESSYEQAIAHALIAISLRLKDLAESVET